MGVTFGGEAGFGQKKVEKHKSSLGVIYETEVKNTKDVNALEGDFKENMLLSFYDWPKIESSNILNAKSKNATIEAESKIIKPKQDLPYQSEIEHLQRQKHVSLENSHFPRARICKVTKKAVNRRLGNLI